MSNVIDFKKAREEREPHMTGSAHCFNCGHEWAATAPLGTVSLECPECHLNYGRFIELVRDEGPHWTCNCGNQFFRITQERIYCVVCGETAEGF